MFIYTYIYIYIYKSATEHSQVYTRIALNLLPPMRSFGLDLFDWTWLTRSG